jgi:hypothetical protein
MEIRQEIFILDFLLPSGPDAHLIWTQFTYPTLELAVSSEPLMHFYQITCCYMTSNFRNS